MQAWKLQDAKARLSEVVDRAREQPQQITRHGKPAAVVIGQEEFERLSARNASEFRNPDGSPMGLKELLLAAPKDDIEFERIEFNSPLRDLGF